MVPALLAATLWGLTALASGCRGGSPNEPVAQTSEACCKVTSQDRQRSAGCRVGGRCRAGEPVWMRGAVSCGPVEPERCMGGRCCRFLSLDEQQSGPIYDWENGSPPEPAPTPEAGSIDAPAAPGGDGPVSGESPADAELQPPEGM